LERTRLEVQDIANKAARQVFARQNVRILAAEHVRQIVRREVGGRFKQLDSRIEDLPAGITDPYCSPTSNPATSSGPAWTPPWTGATGCSPNSG
jgi:hypothetical protein